MCSSTRGGEGGIDSTQSEFNLKRMFFPRDNVMDDPFVMDNPFLGLFLCLPAWLSAGRWWWWGRGGYKARRLPPGLDRPGVASAYADCTLSPNQLPAPALYSSDQKYKSSGFSVRMAPPPTRAPVKAHTRTLIKAQTKAPRKNSHIPVKW